MGSIPGSVSGSGRSPGRGNGSPFHHSCLENPIDGEAWRPTVRRIAESRTRMSARDVHVYMSTLLSQRILPSPSPATSPSPFSTSASPFLPCRQAHQYHFSRFHMKTHILISALASLPSLTWEERGPLFWRGLHDPWPLACEPCGQHLFLSLQRGPSPKHTCVVPGPQRTINSSDARVEPPAPAPLSVA